MTWSSSSHHCWERTDNQWQPIVASGDVAGCIAGTIPGCSGPPPPWNGTSVTATIETSVAIGHVNPLSPGVALDFWKWNDPTYGVKWHNSSAQEIDLSDPGLRALASALSPALLRIGGSPDDSIVFDVDGTCVPGSGGNGPAPNGYYCSQVHPYVYDCLTPQRWEALLEFASSTGLKIAFGLNGCYGRMSADSPMNISNAVAIIAAAAASPHVSALWGFELSNEVVPNTISPAAWSRDAASLSAAAAPLFAAVGLPTPPFAGPAQGGCLALGGVAATIPKGVLGALTYHQYPECVSADPAFTLNPSCLDQLDSQATGCVAAAAPAPGPPFPAVWAGETADHSGGGVPGLTDTFRSSFYYAWQLGALPANGVELAARQCLSGGDYELLQRGSFAPNPDYWVAWLFKALFGGAVPSQAYNVSMDVATDISGVRAFAFSPSVASNSTAAGGGILAMNLGSSPMDGGHNGSIALVLAGVGIAGRDRIEYHLTSLNVSEPHGAVLCNGVPLAIDPVTHAPQPWQGLGVRVAGGVPVTLAPASIVFATVL